VIGCEDLAALTPLTILQAMSTTYQYSTRPTSAGDATTTQAEYRGTKTEAEVRAEIQARLGETPLSIDLILRTAFEVIIDWTTQGWKVTPCHDLMSFKLTTGGSTPLGAPESWDFDSMRITMNCLWGAAAEARSRAQFAAEKTGEQGRAVPEFVEVYHSETREPNRYEPLMGLYCRLGNNRIRFDRAQGCKMRFRKADNTYVDAAGYPFVKGNTVVCTPPAGLTGTVYLECTALINGALRTAEYPFPLT